MLTKERMYMAPSMYGRRSVPWQPMLAVKKNFFKRDLKRREFGRLETSSQFSVNRFTAFKPSFCARPLLPSDKVWPIDKISTKIAFYIHPYLYRYVCTLYTLFTSPFIANMQALTEIKQKQKQIFDKNCFQLTNSQPCSVHMYIHRSQAFLLLICKR
jgi:hypothetical protein